MAENDFPTEIKDHDHDLRKEHVGGPRMTSVGTVEVGVWVACSDDECAGYWTGTAELTIEEVDYDEP